MLHAPFDRLGIGVTAYYAKASSPYHRGARLLGAPDRCLHESARIDIHGDHADDATYVTGIDEA